MILVTCLARLLPFVSHVTNIHIIHPELGHAREGAARSSDGARGGIDGARHGPRGSIDGAQVRHRELVLAPACNCPVAINGEDRAIKVDQ